MEILLRKLPKLLAYRRVGLDVSDKAKVLLVDRGYEPAFGARPLTRVILKNLQDPMAQAMLEGGYADGDTVAVDVESGDFSFSKKA